MSALSLRARVTLWYVSLLAAALVAFAALLYLGLQTYLDNSLRNGIKLENQLIARNILSQVDTKGNRWLVSELSESYAPDDNHHIVKLSRVDGAAGGREVLYQFGSPRELELLERGSQLGTTDYFRQEPLPGVGVFTIYTLRYKTPKGAVYEIESGASHAPIDSILRSLLLALLILTPAILICATVGGYLLMSRPLSPLVALAHQAESIGICRKIERLSVFNTGDEFETLSMSLNRMIDRLEEALEHNRRFSADVSHELRTPLTVLRGELEELLSSFSFDEILSEALGSALEEIERMSKIVESLLAISVLESGANVRTELVFLDRLALSTAEEMRLLIDEKHLRLSCHTDEAVIVSGSEIRLKQIIVNLLDNAIKYTGTGKGIDLSVSSRDGKAIVRIQDQGIGISSECLPHVTERFYRANKARSRDASGGGLGLSIVEAICRAHEGDLHIESQEGVGTLVRFEMALAKPSLVPSQREEPSSLQRRDTARPLESSNISP